jgi:hypothetical protein
MPDFWITTYWPIPRSDPPFSRHVYVKDNRANVPKPGAFIFVRESIDAKIGGRRVRIATMHHRDERAPLKVPKGSGGIIGTMTVVGSMRPIQSNDVVFDFGDLKEWSIIPCEGFQAARLSLRDLREVLNVENPRFLNLWQMPESLGEKLLKAISR